MMDATSVILTVSAALRVLNDTAATVHLTSVQLLLRVTLENLAPWIMICIALWGIARLFQRGNSTPNNTAARHRRDADYYDDPYDDEDIYDEEDS